MIVVISLRCEGLSTRRSKDTDPEASDLLCMLLSEVLYKYSYNEKYIALVRVCIALPASFPGAPKRPAHPLRHDAFENAAERVRLPAARSPLFSLFFPTANPLPHLRVRNPGGPRQLHPIRLHGGRLRSLSISVRCRWTTSSPSSPPRSTPPSPFT